ncbi:radical SAM/SPASM domain-containing protein [Thermococcus barophilus]|uniref:Arylsulfatase regulatory protein n=1 Tax=Thermococcus barophilus (strain DSM 11836 / MP) TaxID=391623 RepID=F0LK28_THEBM|nr:radical SAM protein [Thermococcus barophilus]ADT84740.1 arylsulfatase regulatory protein [Thermococcus barophilus MP]
MKVIVCVIKHPSPLYFLMDNTPHILPHIVGVRRKEDMMGKENISQYKPSFYNLIIPLNEEGEFVLFNTLRNIVARIDRETKEGLETGSLERLDNETITRMRETGVIIPKNLDELDYLKYLRILHLGNMLANSRVGLTLVMTYSCNLACPYCYEGDRKTKGGLLTPKKIDKILTFAKNHEQNDKKPIVSISFYGGEPLLNWKGCKYTLKRLKEMKDEGEIRDYSTSFVTNGILINEETIDAINTYNVYSMQITLDGPRDIHDKRRIKINGEGTFDEIIENIKLLKNEVTNEKFRLGLRINVDKTNYKRIPELLDFLKKEGLNDIPISYGIVRSNIPYCSDCSNTHVFLGRDLPEYLPFLWKEAYRRGFKITTRPNLKFVYCVYDNPNGYVVDPELKVYPCWEMVGAEKYIIGKIKEEGSFEPEPFYYTVKTRNPIEFEECKNCKLLPICMGGCAAESTRRNGHPNGPGCDITKYVWKEGLKFYLMRKYPNLFTNKELTEILGTVPMEENSNMLKFKL